mmetsp:Transcript_137353/g.342536  ORF Transcript_137353/g.342536 Transcript_137353/m.342536 type:complete len:382 (-) Transcript_137353:804-1949(-)
MTLVVPPGACVKRGNASGVEKATSRRAWRSLKSSAALSAPSTTPSAPPTGPRTGDACAPAAAPGLKSMEAVPPGACWKRGAASGVSMARVCWSWYCWKASAAVPSPSSREVGPPTGPRADGASSGPAAAPRTSEEEPPGACGKRGAASGVSMPASLRCWASENVALESSLPKTTVVWPPTGGPVAAASLMVARGARLVLKSIVACPPGACGNRAKASGVSTSASRSRWRSLKTSEGSSPPRTMVAGPPTGPFTGATPSGASPPKVMDEEPPVGWGKRDRASGVSTGASLVFCLSWYMAAASSPPSTTEVAPPTGPRTAGTETSPPPSPPRHVVIVDAPPTGPRGDAATDTTEPSAPPRQTVDEPPGACGKRAVASGVSAGA